ncbi:MAG: transporter substrate-binding domain-containing protein [Peptococcaceae bacterium]|jgi:L-cystine transport system substrate-binding protein|nr:transporter substrate-binding domain-containing protein [Peptococcaceae bacterium]
MKKTRISSMALIVTLFTALLLSGCGNSQPASTGDAAGNGAEQVKTLNLAVTNYYWPVAYEDDNGQPAGYAIELWNRLDEDLPEYKFNYILTTLDDILVGMETGTYEASPGGWYYSAVRAEKYLYPKLNNGGGIVGLILSKEDAAANKTFADAIANKLRFTPTPANVGFIGIIQQYNQDHPDAPIPVELAQEQTVALDYQNIIDGRYDVTIGNKHAFNEIVEVKGRTDIKDALTFNSVTLIKAYDLFRKDQGELVAKYEALLEKYKDDGYLSELSIKYFGEDLFLLDDEGN